MESIDDIITQGSGWNRTGTFCGGQGGDSALSALLNFPSAQAAGWLRFTLATSGVIGSNPSFESVGEIAVFRKD